MIHSILPRAVAILLGLAIFPGPTLAQDTRSNEGGDLAFGGPGAAPGKFLELRDIAFDAGGNLYVLDGAKYDAKTKERTGNLRVQKFSSDGKLLTNIDLRDEASGEMLGVRNDPQRLAVDARGNVFVTQPSADRVQRFGVDGKFVQSLELPAAMAIATWGRGDAERIAVLPSRRGVVKGKQQWLGGDRISVLGPKGDVERTIALEVDKPLEKVMDLAADRDGNFYVQAEPNAIYKFSPAGKLLKTLGGNPTTRSEDGSELLHTVAVDSKGNVYAFTWGNPGLVTRFDADGKGIVQRGGQFKFADPWSVHSGYAVLAIDPSDRLWAANTNVHSPKNPNYERYRAVPAVVRVKADFFDNPPGLVRRAPTHTLGFRPRLTCTLPYNVAYETGKPVPMEYVVTAANRNVKEVTVSWQAFDAEKRPVGKGAIPLPLTNGQEARANFAFTPPAFGSYFVIARAHCPEGEIGSLGEHVGVSPRWPNMPVLQEGESKGGWEDAPRQLWSGLPNMRLHPKNNLDKFDEDLTQAEKYGATVVAQLVDNLKNFKPDEVRAFMERFKGRVKFVEVCNEPNFFGSIDDYFKIHKQAYDIVKKIDPKAQVLGPGTVNIDLKWLARLYELGFKDVCDVVTLHDYEGHESISPEHWRWKFSEIRKILAKYGDGDKQIWQTERAIAGVRGQNFQGLVQAIRTTMHRDLLETLGVPSAHNNHYYLNQGGYSSVPSYLWSKNGPHPGALALRTRHALTAALDRRYAGTLDFGPSAIDFFLGVRYLGKDGETIALRNLGTSPTPFDFEVQGTESLDVVDAWGNTQQIPVKEGKARLSLEQLPSYVRLPVGAKLIAAKRALGKNLAGGAKFAYSGNFKGELEWLSNGILETYHAGNPNGDTNGKKIWTGELPADLKANPPSLEMTFDKPRRIERLVVRGIRADNAFCALLAYDLQYHDGKDWQTIESVERRMPASEAAKTADAIAAIWMDDTNFYLHQFAPISTAKLRLVVRGTSHGFVADDQARAWGNVIARSLMLREIEIYGAE